jgi:RHS repeat-associated protein
MTVTQYVWDQDNILYETDGNDAVNAEYTYSPERYGELISEHRDGETYTHYYDAQGSTLAMTDESGHVTDRFTYNAWGEEVARTGTTETPWRWVGAIGYFWETAIGAYLVRRRIVNPAIARWTSVDPFWRLLDGSSYAYCSNRSLQYVDPSGLLFILSNPKGTDDKDCVIHKSRLGQECIKARDYKFEFRRNASAAFAIQLVELTGYFHCEHKSDPTDIGANDLVNFYERYIEAWQGLNNRFKGYPTGVFVDKHAAGPHRAGNFLREICTCRCDFIADNWFFKIDAVFTMINVNIPNPPANNTGAVEFYKGPHEFNKDYDCADGPIDGAEGIAKREFTRMLYPSTGSTFPATSIDPFPNPALAIVKKFVATEKWTTSHVAGSNRATTKMESSGYQ